MNPLTAVQPSAPVAPLEIAFADDVPEIQLLAREWLTRAGHNVSCAANGRELARLCDQQRFDVVITDVMMPESDGFEVVTSLKKLQPGVRLIVISGGGSILTATDSLRVATRLGADAVLAKPFSGAQLMDMIARVTYAVPGVGR